MSCQILLSRCFVGLASGFYNQHTCNKGVKYDFFPRIQFFSHPNPKCTIAVPKKKKNFKPTEPIKNRGGEAPYIFFFSIL